MMVAISSGYSNFLCVKCYLQLTNSVEMCIL